MNKLAQNQSSVLVVCPNPSIDTLAIVESWEEGKSNRIISEQKFPGGKGVHVAMALAELGIHVDLLGIWGGESGQWLRNEISKYYPSINCIGTELEQWNRPCYTFQSTDKVKETELLGIGPSLSKDKYLEFKSIYQKNLATTEYVCLSGSWPKNAPENAYAELVEMANQANKKTFVDCTGIQFKNIVASKPYLIHLNRNEITEFIGNENFEECLDKGTALAQKTAITDGKNGLYFGDKDQIYHANYRLEQSQVISTVGCGDCLTAGLIYAHLFQYTEEQMASWGVAFGAANCLRPELGMLRAKDVLTIREQVTTHLLVKESAPI